MRHSYYMTQRPPMPGAMPAMGLINVESFKGRKMVDEIGRPAYAKITYTRELSGADVAEYELIPEFYKVQLTRKDIMNLISILKNDGRLVDNKPELLKRFVEALV